MRPQCPDHLHQRELGPCYEHVRRLYGTNENFDDAVRETMTIRMQELMGPDAFIVSGYHWLLMLWLQILGDVDTVVLTGGWNGLQTAIDVLLMKYPSLMLLVYAHVKMLKCCGLVLRHSIVAKAAHGILFLLIYLTYLGFSQKIFRVTLSLPVPIDTYGDYYISLGHICPAVCFGVVVAYEAFGYSKIKSSSRILPTEALPDSPFVGWRQRGDG